MARLLVITRPELVAGFRLSGVEAFGVEDVESAQELVQTWWQSGEVGLLAIDDGILENMEPSFIKRLEANERMPFLAIPGGKALGPEISRKYRIAEMVRRTIGVHITFKGEGTEVVER